MIRASSLDAPVMDCIHKENGNKWARVARPLGAVAARMPQRLDIRVELGKA